jgi:hypothetical protein
MMPIKMPELTMPELTMPELTMQLLELTGSLLVELSWKFFFWG